MQDPAPLPPGFGPLREFEIYEAGEAARRSAPPIAPEALEARARALLSPAIFDYVAGGAGAEETLRANRAAFLRWRIVPRLLRDVAQRDLGVTILGQRLPAPLLLAPIGVQSLLHPAAERAAARAAATLGVPFILSSAASTTMEEVARLMGSAPRWFQLYWSRDPEVTASLVERAEKAGYGALVVTLDTAQLGWRERDLQRAYLPFLQGEGIANYVSDPAFRAALSRPPEADPAAAIRHFLGLFANPSLAWDDLAFLRERTRLPILLKGILHPDDARRAVDAGAAGIVVSNHGGRQVDGAVASLDALPGVVAAIMDRLPVLFDSGIRRGPDAVKALALGAAAVCLGRPYLWGLTIAGEAGVREVLRNFLADLDLTLALSGCTSPSQLSAATLVPVADAR
jgi:isopentenyl diphosphate isomerase/L-lactate dehydrogenase-like FMN-dependent dehydrogenase